MEGVTSLSQLPILGVVAHNYLRETGLLHMREDVRIAFFGSLDSSLHRIADFSCPLPGLDTPDEVLMRAVENAAARGIKLDGLISMRDANVPAVTAIARRMWPARSPSADAIHRVSSKLRFRHWLNDDSKLPEDLTVRVACEALPFDIEERLFAERLRRLLLNGPVIVKPECGSCSYHIIPVGTADDIPHAWQQFKLAEGFRKGSFIAEQEIIGEEMAVETVVDDKVRHVGITPYLPPDPGMFYEVGHYVPNQIPDETRARITKLAESIHDALPLRHVITHMEVKIQADGKPAVVELNPRLAGDLTQELHRLVTGIDYYRIAAHVATGMPIPSSLFGSRCLYRCALIKFHRPIAGQFRQVRDPTDYFKTPDDRFGLCQPKGSILTGGNTNDDRSAYILLAGNERSELESRASEALENCFTVDRASFFVAPT